MTTTNHLRMSVALVAAVVAGAILMATLLAGTKPAEAAFPGKNGKIAFHSNRNGNFEIYRMNPDGSNQQRLTNNPAIDFGPVYSPNGKKMAFASGRDGNWEIYKMNAGGGSQTRLTFNAAFDQNPSWQPLP